MSPYPIKFKYSLDYIEHRYQEFIRENFIQYVNFWEDFVGISSIKNGYMKGYRFTYSKRSPKQARIVEGNLYKIRKTSYSILVQLILLKETDRAISRQNSKDFQLIPI